MKIRQSTCNQCKYGRSDGLDYHRSYCELSQKLGNAERACWCERWQARLHKSAPCVSEHGFKYRSKQTEDYRTMRQWGQSGYRVKEGMTGHEMHASVMSSRTYIYFLPDEVEYVDDDKERDILISSCL